MAEAAGGAEADSGALTDRETPAINVVVQDTGPVTVAEQVRNEPGVGFVFDGN